MRQETVNKILQKTEKGYDLISDKFSQTRNRFWGNLEFIKNYTEAGDRVFDYGCGNGRLLELFLDKKINYFGSDVSEKLLNLAREKYLSNDFQKEVSFQKMASSQISLPFLDNYFNTTYSIAVFHHLPSWDLRLKIAKELHRTLKPGGHIVITVWNLWQKKYRKNIFKNWQNKLISKTKSAEELDWNDCWVNFTDNEGQVFQRYHHAFTRRDLKKLFKESGFEIEKCEIIGGNIVLVGRKKFTEKKTIVDIEPATIATA